LLDKDRRILELTKLLTREQQTTDELRKEIRDLKTIQNNEIGAMEKSHGVKN
jgi:predicted RNase H-like nuclease (RuvC/YqgF family)